MPALSSPILSPDQIATLRTALYSVATIAEALDDMSFARGADYTLRDNTSSATRIHAAIPIDEDAASAWLDLKRVLVGWASLIGDEKMIRYIVVNKVTGKPAIGRDGRVVIGDGPIGVTCGGSLAELADFIAEHLGWLASHPAALDASEELGMAIADASIVAGVTRVERAVKVVPENAKAIVASLGTELPSTPQAICKAMNKQGMKIETHHIRNWFRDELIFAAHTDDKGFRQYLMTDVINVYNSKMREKISEESAA